MVVRYADDIVVGFQNPDDAARFRREIAERLQAFGLALHPDKTRLIRFGRFAHEQNRERGLGKPETFNFLGFTHICGVSRQGRFLIHRKTRRDRLQAKLKAISQELKKRFHDPVRATGLWLRNVVQGRLNSFGVPLNGATLSLFCTEVRFRWYRALCRRSQRKRLNWKRFGKIADHWIPKATIVHPYPQRRFDAKYSRVEPDALAAPIRICAGGAERSAFLPRPLKGTARPPLTLHCLLGKRSAQARWARRRQG